MNKHGFGGYAKSDGFWKQPKRSKVVLPNLLQDDFADDSGTNDAMPLSSKKIKTQKTNMSLAGKADLLKKEGIFQAEKGNLDEALTRWSEAIAISPKDETLYEMQSQVLMMQEKDFRAVQQAEKACQLRKNWGIGWQTLGRAQINLGHLELAVKSFSRALHLNPWDDNLRNNDLTVAVERWDKFQDQ